jgi:alkylation response protein AidB-like acyl-CoA dehydrogenase
MMGNNDLRQWEDRSVKHAYIPRMTSYALSPDDELNDLRMSEQVRPLYDHVRQFIRETVEPMSVEFYRHGEKKTDRWSFTPEQLEVLGKAKAKAKEVGLWNFFLPDAETGEGLKNLDYAYIAAELGKSPLASETMNCSAPDTGNMEVIERVGTKEQKEKWLKPLLNGEIRSAYAMTEPNVASSDVKNISTEAKLVGDEWVINGEKYYISGLGDPRCKIMIVMVKTSPDEPRVSSSRRSWCPRTPRVSRSSDRCMCSGTTTPHAAICICASTMSGCRRRTFCSARAAVLKFRSCGSGRAASITACGPSARPKRRST